LHSRVFTCVSLSKRNKVIISDLDHEEGGSSNEEHEFVICFIVFNVFTVDLHMLINYFFFRI